MLAARGVRLAYPGCPVQPAIIDIQVSPGELVALTGDNGTGKSLLALTLAGLVRPAEGEVTLGGTLFPSPGGGHERVGILFQDPESQLITGEVEREIAFPLENLGWPRAEIDRQVAGVMAQLSIGHLSGRSLAGLSGGEKSRVALAAALAARPRYLILDEPGVYLDPGNRRRLREVLAACAAGGLGILLITQLQEEWQAASRRLRLGGAGIEAADSDVLAGRPAPPRPQGSDEGEVVLAARGISFCYPDGGLAPSGGGSPPRNFSIREADLELHAGETIFLVGESGSGKTTLLLLLAGVLEPTGGEFRVNPGTDPANPDTHFGVLLQSPEDQLVSATVLDDVLLGLREAGLERQDAEDRAFRVLAEAGLDPSEIAGLPPGALSHGQRRRVAWCGIWLLKTGIWLLDEPTAGLDEAGLDVLLDAISEFSRTGGAVLVVTQDPRLDSWPGRRLYLEDGVLRVVGALPERSSGVAQRSDFA
jgi:energy-coupling factor transporter ATP-binding protein EcfA2